jgi:hypothetical protein
MHILHSHSSRKPCHSFIPSHRGDKLLTLATVLGGVLALLACAGEARARGVYAAGTFADLGLQISRPAVFTEVVPTTQCKGIIAGDFVAVHGLAMHPLRFLGRWLCDANLIARCLAVCVPVHTRNQTDAPHTTTPTTPPP